MFLRRFVVLFSLFIVPAASAVTVGTMPIGGGLTVSRGAGIAPLTLVDLTNPATESGILNRAAVKWILAPDGGCQAALKIKVVRQTTSGGFLVIADRGPFNVVNGLNVITLSPPISVTSGDLLAFTQVRPTNECGGVSHGRHVSFGATRVAIFSDPAEGTTASSAGIGSDVIGGVRASTTSEVLEGYLTAVGSVRGAFGSNFKTSVQLTNADDFTIHGRFVFHRAGAVASASDPILSFTLPAGATVSYDDLVASMGQTGLGSIDVFTFDSYPPEITVRVFNDDGAGGTSGVTQELRVPQLALTNFQQGLLTVPSDLTNLRLNIGVRTLDQGVSLLIGLFDAQGFQLGNTVARSYPVNYFEQVTAAEFLERTSIPPNSVIVVRIAAGSAIVYGAITDNKTNDPNLKWFTRF